MFEIDSAGESLIVGILSVESAFAVDTSSILKGFVGLVGLVGLVYVH